jgi:uncharacterized repeat protein (TIGR03803 family)
MMVRMKRCQGRIWRRFLSVTIAALGILLAGLINFAQAQTNAPNHSRLLRQNPTYSTLYTFTGGADGWSPQSGVIADSAGNLYGTTWVGGAYGYGEVFKLDTAGEFTVLYSFKGGADGGYPRSLTWGRNGNLFGTTWRGGTSDEGTVFKLDAAGNETVLYTFSGGLDGGEPAAGPVVLDAAGNIYGTTNSGGGTLGVVFKLDTTGQETVLYTFPGGAYGATPDTSVIRDAAGNLYGTTAWGGTCWLYLGCGVVFKLDPAGNYTVLHSFTDLDGEKPEAGLIRDTEGNLYGTTWEGGGYSDGVVFKLAPDGTYTVLYSSSGRNGARFNGILALDGIGNLYGTSYYGGSSDSGVIFKLDPEGNYRVLYNFKGTGGADSGNPAGGILLRQGSIYGTATGGDNYGHGVVFRLSR